MDGRQEGQDGGGSSGGSLILTNIGELATPLGRSARAGAQMGQLLRIKNAGVVVDKGVISFCGEMSDPAFCDKLDQAKREGFPILDANGMACAPDLLIATRILSLQGRVRTSSSGAQMACPIWKFIVVEGGFSEP